MASPAAASSPEVYMSAEELAEEIEYQKVLLLSLDVNVEYRKEAEAEIKGEIKSLEKRLKALRAGHHNPITSTLGDMPFAVDDDPFGSFRAVSCKHHFYLISTPPVRPRQVCFKLPQRSEVVVAILFLAIIKAFRAVLEFRPLVEATTSSNASRFTSSKPPLRRSLPLIQLFTH